MIDDNIDFLKQQSEKINEYLKEHEEDIDFSILLEDYGIDLKKLEDDMTNHKTKLGLKYSKLVNEAVSPKYNYDGDSGFDLYSTIDITIDGLGRGLVPTGLSFDIPDGYEIQVRSKSGLAINQGLMVFNSPGRVDNSYTGEIKVIIFNTNKESFNIPKGMKIAQAVLCPVVNGGWVNLVQKNKLTEKDRGSKGFGSTKLF